MPEATPREKELSEELARSTVENARVSRDNERMRIEIKLLREKIDALVRRVFRAQSEKLDAAQLLLMLARARRAPKSAGARGGGGATALDGSITSA